MNFFTRCIAAPLGVVMIALGLMIAPVTTPVAVAQEIPAAQTTAAQPRKLITDVRAELQTRSSEITELAQTSEAGPGVDEATASLAEAQFRADLALKGLSTPGIEIIIVPEAETQALLDAASGALAELEADYSAWTEAVEAARIEREAQEAAAAAEAAAAEEAAAAAAAAEQEAAAAQPAPADNGAPAPAGYTVYPAGSGDQDLIDACVGPVWTGGLPMYLAEHWYCGGAGFPLYPGAVVTVAGVGMFQSVGVIIQLDGPNSTYDAIPGGYDLYYQTCLNNNPATTGVVGLQRIG